MNSKPWSIQQETENSVYNIRLKGCFTFACRSQFLQSIDKISEAVDQCIIDLTETDYIDSSGLGMLLILKGNKLFNKNNIEIKVKKNSIVYEIIYHHNFQNLFTISE